MDKKILGLDLGTNSVAWSLLNSDDKGKPVGLIDTGVRIFTKSINDKSLKPKNEERRNKRLTRRVLERKARRKSRLRNYLVKLNLLPEEIKHTENPEILLQEIGDPYQLRKKALDEKLENYELGRALLHFATRRGFLSSKKTILGDLANDPDFADIEEETDDKEETAFKKDIHELENKIRSSGARTLGEYQANLPEKTCKRNRNHDDFSFRTERKMYLDEIELIFDKQKPFHTVLTDEVTEEIKHIIFHQRPLKLLSDRVGKCSLEPKKNRARKSRMESQQFRYLQDINHLSYTCPYENIEKTLNDEDRQKLIDQLELNEKVSFTQIRKLLGFDKTVKFNLESAKYKALKGNITAHRVRKAFEGFDSLQTDEKYALVEDLITISKKSVLKNRLSEHWKFDKETIKNLCLIELEAEHMNLSSKAINKLIPFLKQGQRYDQARVSAGYGYEIKEEEISDLLPTPPEIPNPIVQRALNEIRRVVNAVIQEYGKPDYIRIEMSRDLEMNTKRYKAGLKRKKDNEKLNNKAKETYREFREKYPSGGLSKYATKTDIIKYRLWTDQNELCAYSGRKISLKELFSSTCEIDHIIPYSLSLDDSYGNKVVCFANENRDKGSKTPIEHFGSDEAKWDIITQGLSNWHIGLKFKKQKFYKKSNQMEKDFTGSSLTDTRYISKEAMHYLKQLGSDVSTSKGTTTAWIRHQWDLNTLINSDDKKDRSDHRHHAIDATVVACIDRSFYQTLVKIAKELEKNNAPFSMKDMVTDTPWDNFREDLDEKLQQMIISFKPEKKIKGALHEDTGLGYKEDVGIISKVILDKSFNAKKINTIIDPTVKNIVKNHLAKYNNSEEAFEKNTVYHKNGNPIYRVRIIKSTPSKKDVEAKKVGIKDKKGKIFKWHTGGNIHHIEIVKNIETGKTQTQVIYAFEAKKRAKQNKPVIQTNHGKENELVMALHRNDFVSITIDEQKFICRVQKFSGNGTITLRLHTSSNVSEKAEGVNKNDPEIDKFIKIQSIARSYKSFKQDFDIKPVKVNILGKIIEAA